MVDRLIPKCALQHFFSYILTHYILERHISSPSLLKTTVIYQQTVALQGSFAAIFHISNRCLHEYSQK
jgi:hypothetical protein